MAFGSPVVFNATNSSGSFTILEAISVHRDDPASFDEKLLQELIDEAPNVLPVRDFLPAVTGLYPLAREVTVDLGGNTGRIDNLLLTNDGHLVIVETKLYRNPEATRDVVTQTLQYGMALSHLSLPELETRIRQGQTTALRPTESICDAVTRMAGSGSGETGTLADDLEASIETFLRRGEVLMLVVSDRIRTGVERIAAWLNESGTSPFKFGLVELRIFTFGERRVVFPRTLLKTREVSRHVVTVDIQRTADVSVSTTVKDEFRRTTGGTVQKSRAITSSGPMLTRAQLLEKVLPEDRTTVQALLDQLDAYGFDERAKSNYLLFGFTFPADDGEFHPLIYVGVGGIWTQALKPLRDRLTDQQLIEFHRAANEFGTFYRDDQVNLPNSTGAAVKYSQLRGPVAAYVAFLDAYRGKFIELMGE